MAENLRRDAIVALNEYNSHKQDLWCRWSIDARNAVLGETRVGLADLSVEGLGWTLEQLTRTGCILRGVLAPYRAIDPVVNASSDDTLVDDDDESNFFHPPDAFHPTFRFPCGPFGPSVARRQQSNDENGDSVSLFDVRPLAFPSVLGPGRSVAFPFLINYEIGR